LSSRRAKIPLVIEFLITAVRNGELDDQLAQGPHCREVRPRQGGGIRASDEDPVVPLATSPEYRGNLVPRTSRRVVSGAVI
jgi:hypothetical protein